MRIAAVTEDGNTISQHFGRAPYYAVLTVDDGRIVGREMREKWGHAQVTSERGPHGADARGHGFDAASQERHSRMTAAIADCDVLLARGMGAGAYQSLVQAGIQPMLTDISDIDAAVQAYIEGRLVDHPERLH